MSRLELGWDLKLYNDMLDVLESQIRDINNASGEIYKKYTGAELEGFKEEINQINNKIERIMRG